MCGYGVAGMMQHHNVSCMDSIHTIVVNLVITPLK